MMDYVNKVVDEKHYVARCSLIHQLRYLGGLRMVLLSGLFLIFHF